MRTTRLVLIFGVALCATITALIFGVQTRSVDQSEPRMVSVSAVDFDSGHNVITVGSERKRDKREATCDNPVVTSTEPIAVELKNEALIKASEALDKFEAEHGVVATPEEEQAYFKQVAQVLPVEVVTETVFVNEAASPGEITESEADPSDSEEEKVKNEAKRTGCGGKNRNNGAQFVSFSTVAYDNSVGWKSCSKTVSFKALNGLTVGKLRLVSEWYNNIYQVPQWIEARATGTAYYLWSTDGDEELRIARPYYKYSSGVWYAYQNRAWQDFVYKISAGIGGVGGSIILDSHELYVAHIVGPGGKCV